MWIKALRKSVREEEPRSPLDFHPRSNGEFMPWDPTPREIYSDKLFHELAAAKAARLGVSRRGFIESACGMATALVVLNQVMGCRLYDVGEDHTFDPALAKNALSGAQFIFDGHTHPSNLNDIDTYVRALFINSATTMAVITVGQGGGTGPDDTQGWAEHAAIRELVNRISGGRRVVIQGKVWPKRRGAVATDQGQLQLMETMAKLWKVSAWKAYPHEADNWALDDERYGIPFIERGRELGIKIFAVHKGLGSASPVDMPVVAKRYPDCAFVVFHSGVDDGRAELAYDATRAWGMDRMIASWEKNGKPANLYADLGSIWNLQQAMSATAAGHMLGKLLKYLGEDKVVWGTDALVVGQPGPQIASFNAYQIPQALQDQFGYPALTPAIKAKILGQNLAKVYGLDPAAALKAVTEDELTKMRTLTEAGELPYRPHFGYGPRTRREFFAMLRDPSHPARG